MSEHTEVDDISPYTLNNVDSKKAFVKRVGVIPNSSWQIMHNFISIEKDLDNVYGFVPESIFYRMGRPIMWLERFVGQTAYQIDSGWIKYSYKSFPFVYIVFVAITQIVLTVWNWEHLKSAINKLSQTATYETILLSCLVLVQVPSFLVGIYSWFFEVPSIVKCYNMSAAIEKRMLDLFSTISISTRKIHFWTALIGLDLVISMVLGSFIIHGSDLYTHSFAVPFMFNFTRSHLASLHSCYVFTFSRDLARKLRESMMKWMQNEECQHYKLKICHNLWVEIWSVSQGHANSLAITLLVQIMCNLLFFTTASYGMIVLIKVGDIQQIIELTPYFFLVISNVVLICESAQNAQDELGDTFLRALMSMDKHSMSHESIEQVNNFMNTIVHTEKAKLTLKNYINIGRPLLVTLLSTSVTYLVVLLQFHSSAIDVQMSPDNSTAPGNEDI